MVLEKFSCIKCLDPHYTLICRITFIKIHYICRKAPLKVYRCNLFFLHNHSNKINKEMISYLSFVEKNYKKAC